MKALALVIALAATPAVADGNRPLPPGENWTVTNSLGRPDIDIGKNWVLYTQTYGGRIGIEHGLTKDECEVKRKQALGEPATDEERAAARMFEPLNSLCGGAASCSYASPMQTAAEVGIGRNVYVHTSTDILHAECRDKPIP